MYLCDAASACISFEFGTSDGKCYLSSSCNQASAGYAVGGSFGLYIKQRDGWYYSPSPPASALALASSALDPQVTNCQS